jgi:hypothetical protein
MGRDGARLSLPVTALEKVSLRADEGLNVSNSVGQMEDRLGETQVSILCHLLCYAGWRGWRLDARMRMLGKGCRRKDEMRYQADTERQKEGVRRQRARANSWW